MSSHRWAAGLVAVTLLCLAVGAPQAQAAGPASAASSPPTASTPAVFFGAMPCVHRDITFYCGEPDGSGGARTILQFAFGSPGDLPLFGDWNGDGDRTAGVFRPSTFTWYLATTDNATDAPVKVSFGMPGDIPVSGDWTGSGTQTIGVYRPENRTFYLRNSNTSGNADTIVPLGDAGDVPLAGDFDGTGIARVGVYRPSNATFYETHAAAPVSAVAFGNPGDRPLAGSWHCNAISGQANWAIMLFRPSNIGWYGDHLAASLTCPAFTYSFGAPGDLPLIK